MSTDKVDAQEAWVKRADELVMKLCHAFYRLGRHDINPAEPGSPESVRAHYATLEMHLQMQILRAEPVAAANKAVIVEMGADASDMNALHGDAYGVDWVYPAATIAAAQEGK